MPPAVQLIGSARIGGSGDDGANISACAEPANGLSLQQNYGDEGRSEVNLDAAGNVYVAACTQSNNVGGGFPVMVDFKLLSVVACRTGCGDQVQPSLSSVLFSSFFGGSGNDAAYVVSIDAEW